MKDGPRRHWRPKYWRNPHTAAATGTPQYPSFQCFEEGANAMLDALKAEASYMTPQQMRLLAPDRQYPYGHLVFIPDEILGPLPDGPAHMTMSEFIHCVLQGGFIDDDGFGHYATATHELVEPDIDVKPSWVEEKKLDTSWSHIVWYNR